tara:strand:+ start:833 stop:1936 length:1104 start_codon:yes stop_codon:yes gene_type:complete
MEKVLLTSICRPKQWKTIPKKKLLESGYPVYGANGIIGYHSEYTHKDPTLLIGCRGSCGSVIISEEKSYINGNAMALDGLSENFDIVYLKYFLLMRGFEDVISGSSQPQITGKGLSKVQIPFLPLIKQKKIAAILDAADAYRQKTKALIEKYDELAQSLFLDMFGDPVTNPKGWRITLLSNACSKITDGTHDTPDRLKEGVKFITGKHIRPYVIDYDNSDYVDKDVHEIIFRRCNPELGDVLYTNIGANLGTAAVNKVKYEFSMKNVALLKPNKDLIIGRYIEYFLNSENMKKKIVWIGSLGGAQQFLSLTLLRRLKINLPPLNLQNQFAERVQAIESQKTQAQDSLAGAEDLFNSLLQRVFKGELV